MSRADCTVRAVSIVTDSSYADVAALMARDGYRPGRGFHLERWLYGQCDPAIGEPEHVCGWTATRRSVPVQAHGKRHTAESFAQANPHGRFILQQARHVVAVVDGRVEMETRRDGARVYSAWRFTEVNP